jgi:hypothetical protein
MMIAQVLHALKLLITMMDLVREKLKVDLRIDVNAPYVA